MQKAKMFAELVQNVLSHLGLDAQNDVFLSHCASFRPHSRVKGLSDEDLGKTALMRLTTVDKIVFNSPASIPSLTTLYALNKILPHRLFVDYEPSFRCAWNAFASDLDYDDVFRLIRKRSEPVRKATEWNEFKKSIVQDALYCNRKNVLMNVPMLWSNLKGPLVFTDSVIILAVPSFSSAINLAFDNYARNVSNVEDFNLDDLTTYTKFVIASYVNTLAWMNNLSGWTVITIDFDQLMRKNALCLLTPSLLRERLGAYVKPDLYEAAGLDTRLLSEIQLHNLYSMIGEGSLA
jgi:hypothetical protein